MEKDFMLLGVLVAILISIGISTLTPDDHQTAIKTKQHKTKPMSNDEEFGGGFLIFLIGGFSLWFRKHAFVRTKERKAWVLGAEKMINQHIESIKELEKSTYRNNRYISSLEREVSELREAIKDIKKRTGIEAQEEFEKAAKQVAEG